MKKQINDKELTKPLCFSEQNDEPWARCKHKYTGWIENEFICGNCGLVSKREISKKNELGYGFRETHTLPTPYVPKKKGAVKNKKLKKSFSNPILDLKEQITMQRLSFCTLPSGFPNTFYLMFPSWEGEMFLVKHNHQCPSNVHLLKY